MEVLLFQWKQWGGGYDADIFIYFKIPHTIMEKSDDLVCPHCGYKALYWRKRAGNYSCQKCGKSSSRKQILDSGRSKWSSAVLIVIRINPVSLNSPRGSAMGMRLIVWRVARWKTKWMGSPTENIRALSGSECRRKPCKRAWQAAVLHLERMSHEQYGSAKMRRYRIYLYVGWWSKMCLRQFLVGLRPYWWGWGDLEQNV